jgi:hypothetical protein
MRGMRTQAMRGTWPIGAVALGLLIAGTAAAPAAEREHGPHVHGVGQLNVAAEGNMVEIELIAPGADVVGFEHRAENDADKAAVAAAEATLKAGHRLFIFPGVAGCRLGNADIQSEMVDDDDHDDEDAAHKDSDKHETHAAFHAQYRFRCDSPDRLDHVDVKLFERFPSMRALQVQVISPRGQGSRELTPDSARLKF